MILILMTAMTMHCALTKTEALTVSVLLVTLAMEHTVVVRCNFHAFHVSITYPQVKHPNFLYLQIIYLKLISLMMVC